MTSYPAFCDHILHQNELVAAGICHGDTWNLIFINNMLGEILKLSPGRMDDEPFLPRLTRCGFDEVEESLSEPHGGELIAHHKEGSMYIIRWKSVSIDDSAGGEQVRLITMSKIPVDQINRVAELPWQELTVLLDSIHDGIWVIDSDGITLHVPLMDSTRGIINADAIAKMREDVTIVNVSRGELIDTDAVIEAIESEKIGALAMDVFEDEVGIYHENRMHDILANRKMAYLRQFPNVLLTNHIAFYTDIDVNCMVEQGVAAVPAMVEGTCATQL